MKNFSLKRIVWTVIGLFLIQGALNAQEQIQGQPHPKAAYKAGDTLSGETANGSRIRSRIAGRFSVEDIVNWTGEGENEAYLVIQWSDERCTTAYVWGYRFNGIAKGVDLIKAVCNEDPRLYFLTEGGTSYGSTISGIGYDCDGDGEIALMKDGVKIEQYEPGVFCTEGYDYDSYLAYDAEDFWDAGWYTNGYWSYWVGTSPESLGYSGLGASSRVITDGSWDGWIFAKNFAVVGLKELEPAPAAGSNYSAGTYLLTSDGTTGRMSTINKDNSVSSDIFSLENEGKALGTSPSYGTVWGNSLYIVLKEGITVANAKNLAEEASIDNLGGGEGHAFTGISEQKAYISTTQGIVAYDLKQNKIDKNIVQGAAAGTMVKSGKYLYAVQQNSGLLIIDTETDRVVKSISGDFSSVAQTPDGFIWAAAGSELVKVNSASWETERVVLPAGTEIYGSWEDWDAGSFIADVKENVLYWNNKTAGTKGNTIYRFKTGSLNSLAYPFYTLENIGSEDAPYMYGGMRLDARSHHLMFSVTKGEKNCIYMVNADNGDLTAKIETGGSHDEFIMPILPDKAPVFSTDITDSYEMEANAEPFTIDFTGKVSDEDNMESNIELKAVSSNETRIMVSLTGNLLTVIPQPGAVGSSSITVSALSNGQIVSKEIIVNILNHPTNITIDKVSANLSIGYKDTLLVAFDPLDVTNQNVIWSSSNTSVVTVTGGSVAAYTAGFVTSKAAGTATVTATSEDGGFIASCEYSIENRVAEDIKLSQDSIHVGVSLKEKLELRFLPDSVSIKNRSVKWTVANTTVASVSAFSGSDGTRSATITGKTVGETYVYAVTSDGLCADTCKITVDFVPADSIVMNADTVRITIPSRSYLSVKYYPLDSCSKSNVIWSSDCDAVATVNTGGTVTGVKPGITCVRAVTDDEQQLADSCCVIVNYNAVEGVAINSHEITVVTGKSMSLSKTFVPAGVSNSAVTWSSDDVNIATVSSNGSVKGIAEGTTWVRVVTDEGAFTDSCIVNVQDTIKADSIKLNIHEFTLKPNNSKYIYKTSYPSNANTAVVYCSGDTSVVTVSGSCTVKAVAAGTAYVYVRMNGMMDSCLVSVYDKAESVAVNEHQFSLLVRDSLQLSAFTMPATALQEVAWTSSDETVAAVDESGMVRCMAQGTADIIVINNENKGLQDTCRIIVSEQIAQKIYLGSTQMKMMLNDTATIKAVVMPRNATNKRVYWISSDRSVVDVTSYGLVTARSEGEATVTCLTQDAGASAGCSISVFAIPRDTVTVTEIVHDTVTVTETVHDTTYLFVTDFDILPLPTLVVDNDTVIMECAVRGASVYYTLDGRLPTRESFRYTEPFRLKKNCTITAVALMQSEATVVNAVLTDIRVQGLDIAEKRYYTENGTEITVPCKGVNIVRLIYTDGTEKTVKMYVE